MRVLHVITGLNDGGAEAVLFRLICNDSEIRHSVISLTDQGKYGPLLCDLGVEVIALNMPRGRITWSGLRRLWKALKTQRPDVVQTWMYHADFLGGIFGRLMGVPVVWGIRNSTLDPESSSAATIWIARICAKLSNWIPEAIVSCSEKAAQIHSDIGYDARRMVVIPNGYDLECFRPDSERRELLRAAWGISSDVSVVGMVARYDPQKDHSNLIDALAQLKREGCRFRCVLVGSGLDSSNKKLIAELYSSGLSKEVILHGPTKDVTAVMAALDLHVLSSAYGEAFPNVLCEAMACGAPCIATDVGDAAKIVGSTGWIVPPRDPDALAEAISRANTAMQDQEAWSARRARCRERIVDNFSIERMVARYSQVWQSVCSPCAE